MASATNKLDDKSVHNFAPPESGNRILYDGGARATKGFGLRVTSAGSKSFVLNYSVQGRERRITIGAYPTWSVAGARKQAEALRREIDSGLDPLEERNAARQAPTVGELCDRYIAEHASKKRTGSDDESMIRRIVKPELGSRKVASIEFEDIDRLHRRVTTKDKKPYAANRLVALLSKMFALSIRWKMRSNNPAKGVERNDEERRNRYLKGPELTRLIEALATHSNQVAANAVRLLVLTGARRGEVLSATWKQFDLNEGTWTKPSSNTKTKKEHYVPLSGPARQLLVEIKAEADRRAERLKREPSPYVFPARVGNGPMVEIKSSWAAICKTAGLDGVRVHDLRHTYASILVSAGQSLPIIGALLGHTQTSTTARYAHLFDDPLRAATDRVGAIVTGKTQEAEVVDIKAGRGVRR